MTRRLLQLLCCRLLQLRRSRLDNANHSRLFPQIATENWYQKRTHLWRMDVLRWNLHQVGYFLLAARPFYILNPPCTRALRDYTDFRRTPRSKSPSICFLLGWSFSSFLRSFPSRGANFQPWFAYITLQPFLKIDYLVYWLGRLLVPVFLAYTRWIKGKFFWLGRPWVSHTWLFWVGCRTLHHILRRYFRVCRR
jgi:hypothetical protein